MCADKCGTSEVLLNNGVPCVEHRLCLDQCDELVQLLDEQGALVLKPNDGNSGNHVYLCRVKEQLHTAFNNITRASHSVAVSKFYSIDAEYRVVVLDGDIKLVFEKNRPCIAGDGKRTVGQLLNGECLPYWRFSDETIQFEDVLPVGVKLLVDWRHNLCHGATATIVHDSRVIHTISDLVQQVLAVIPVRFASVDIIRCGGIYRVLEVNSMVTLEYFSRQSLEHYTVTEGLYREALKRLFEL